MTTYLGKSCSFGLPRVLFVNCRQFMYLVISLLVLRAGCWIWLYQFLVIAYLFTLYTKWSEITDSTCRSVVIRHLLNLQCAGPNLQRCVIIVNRQQFVIIQMPWCSWRCELSSVQARTIHMNHPSYTDSIFHQKTVPKLLGLLGKSYL